MSTSDSVYDDTPASHPRFDTKYWKTNGLHQADMGKPITQICLVGTAPQALTAAQLQDPGHQGPTNHWIIYLADSSGILASLDMISEGFDYGKQRRVGKLKIQSECDIDEDIAKTFYIATKTYCTITDIVELLAHNGRHKYRFTKDIEGCVAWCKRVLTDFAENGIISDDIPEKATRDIMSSCWWDQNTSQPRPFQSGEFDW